MEIWTVVYSDEVQAWLDGLTAGQYATVRRVVARLEVAGNMLRMPLSKPLGEGLFELRFNLENKARRITYTFQPEQRIITLTTFYKQKNNERREILRARRAQKEQS
ncbi:type II toxin-antitoxin system RelE/ParE family toxin [Brevibacterium sp. 91QC2O2]|uniref:type II toxin-antitoxin system RelE/ParE family toxin n=1 Tax=Brevibacterium TaxID=1696 RepID=UPI00211C7B3D|nr:type II toxin-antitoxin system RelE/ParE family toxin [Brevibacterium sp. 91QC2O2]MCQ9385411.1 type II toxin-antitoxin system RelE/ParE family toxin [Brevibacterium sp. 68QC2CO]